MGVIALMKCNGIKTRVGYFKGKEGLSGTVELECVYTDDESMREFSDASPYGKLELSIDNPQALIQFTPGQWYNITIEKANVK